MLYFLVFYCHFTMIPFYYYFSFSIMCFDILLILPLLRTIHLYVLYSHSTLHYTGLSLVDNVRYGTHTPLGAYTADSHEARVALGENCSVDVTAVVLLILISDCLLFQYSFYSLFYYFFLFLFLFLFFV